MTDEGQISGLNSGATGSCVFLHSEGHSLQLRSSLAFPLAAIVKAEIGKQMWMGEVLACEPEPNGFIVEIQIESYLKDTANVEELTARFRQEGGSSKPDSPAVPFASLRRDI